MKNYQRQESPFRLLTVLREKPDYLSPASRFASMNGIIYLIMGLLLLVFPQVNQIIFFAEPFVGQEQAMLRAMGMIFAIVGWLYIFGGRSGGRQFVVATILDRIVFVPIVLTPFVLSGVLPGILGMFLIVDPTFAIITWILFVRNPRGQKR